MDVDNGEYLAPNVAEDGAAIAMRELVRQLEGTEEVLGQLVALVHSLYHQPLGAPALPWEQCRHVTCRLIQQHQGTGVNGPNDYHTNHMPQPDPPKSA